MGLEMFAIRGIVVFCLLSVFPISAQAAGFTISGQQVGDTFGWSIANAGDVNGDGVADVIIGTLSARKAYVIFGRPGFKGIDLADLNGTNGFRIDSAPSAAVAAAGDVNGDGLDDVVFGGNGTAYVIFGRVNPAPVISTFQLDGTNGFRILGTQGGLAGVDLNNDGFSDIAVGVTDPDSPGRTYVIAGRQTFDATIDVTEGIAFSGIKRGDFAGLQVAPAGDLNNDGFPDLLIGAPGADTKGVDTGEAYVVFGSADPVSLDLADLNGSNGFKLLGLDPGARAAWTVSRAADVNGDGIDDLVLASTDASANEAYRAGVTHILYGSADPFPAVLSLEDLDGTNGFSIEGVEHGVQHLSVDTGDFNGDGYADIAIGSPFKTPDGNIGPEYVYMVYGRPFFPERFSLNHAKGSRGFRLDGGVSTRDFGRVVALADINADGYDDLLFGIAGITSPDAGTVQVIFGQPTAAPKLLPLQQGKYGSAGRDKIRGRGRLIGLQGNDVLMANADPQILEGRSGNDTVTYANATGPIKTRLYPGLNPNPDDYAGWAVNHFYISIENLIGSQFNDWLTGSHGDNIIRGGDGNDRVVGLKGNDRLFGDDGDDILDGGEDDDYLSGGAGRDKLIGGLGRDIFHGGPGGDLFIFNGAADTPPGKNRDTILDFEPGVDRLSIRGMGTRFIGPAKFSGAAGEIRARSVLSDTILSGDIDGDGIADWEIVLSGQPTVSAHDLIF